MISKMLNEKPIQVPTYIPPKLENLKLMKCDSMVSLFQDGPAEYRTQVESVPQDGILEHKSLICSSYEEDSDNNLAMKHNLLAVETATKNHNESLPEINSNRSMLICDRKT